MLHTPQSTPLLLPLTPNKSRRCTNPVVFNPVLILLLPAQSIQAGFLNHHKKRFLLLWSSLNYFPVHQISCTCSLPTPHTYRRRGRWLFSQKRSVDVWQDSKSNPAIYTKNWQHSLECLATFPGIFDDIPQNIWRRFPECLATFPGIFGDIPWNAWRHFPECLTTFPGIFGDVPRNV